MNKDSINKILISYDFFLSKQTTSSTFSLQDVASSTGWSISTVRTYKSKKWSEILTDHGDGNFSANLSNYDQESYSRMMSQNYRKSTNPFKPNLPEKVTELLEKAHDSALLAIDIYNRPIATFRSSGYIVMMIIAWVSLFHAIYELEGINYFYKDKNGNFKKINGDKMAWDLNKCVTSCDNIISEPIKKNLIFFIELRNKIEHRYVPTFDFDIFGECQSMLLNFENLLIKKFGTYYSLGTSLAIPLQITSTRHPIQNKTTNKIQAAHYNELQDYVNCYISSLDDKIYSDAEFSFRVFLIPKIGNHQSSSNHAIEYINYDKNHPEKFNNLQKDIALIKEKTVPVANQGKFKPKIICELLSKKLNKKISLHLHTLCWKFYNVRQSGLQSKCDTKFCQYDEAHKDYIYTQEWIDFLTKKLSDPTELQEIKNFGK